MSTMKGNMYMKTKLNIWESLNVGQLPKLLLSN